ncbi:ADP-ribosylglycohydrolase family protein, partial [Candidatus Hydrogenedentota bacterium]
IERMQTWAEECGMEFPPRDYWIKVPEPHVLHYGTSRADLFTPSKMDGAPVDDDIVYTHLGLLIAEDYGPNFTTNDIGAGWLKYLPRAAIAAKIALENLKKGVPARRAASGCNFRVEYIGGYIRSDPWGYIAPGWPEKAASMAYQDAYLSHRRNGIYGEMFFSAAIAAAFAVDDPIEAIRIGLTEIPKDSDMARGVRWAVRVGKDITNYFEAREAVERHFKGMRNVHTINNACLVIWGLMMAGGDYTKLISEVVAMGMDNDCNAATAGSIFGAIYGKKAIPKHWYKNFNNMSHTYLTGKKKFSITGLAKRFGKQAARTYRESVV